MRLPWMRMTLDATRFIADKERMGEAKKKNQRACPAAGRNIAAVECAEGRISTFACPATCPFNPWRPEAYDEYLKVDVRLREKMMRRLVAECDRRGLSLRPSEEDEIAAGDYMRKKFFIERDAAGRTFVERWADAGHDGLNNDERVLLAAQARMRPTAVEFRCARDESFSQAVDLLADGQTELSLADRVLAGHPARFFRFFGWFVDLPHYVRPHDSVVTVPHVAAMEPREIFEAMVRHRGGLAPGETLEAWLGAHFLEVADLLRSLRDVLQAEAFRRSGVKQAVMTYHLASPRKLVAALLTPEQGFESTDDRDPTLEPAYDAFWDWVELEPARDPSSTPLPTGAARLLGTIAMADDRLMLKIPVTGDAERARQQLEKQLGPHVVFAGQAEVDLGQQYALQLATQEEIDAVPPEILANAPVFSADVSVQERPAEGEMDERAIARDFAARWPDEPVPGLDDRTPRQAAADPALRPRLLRMVQKIAYDTDYRQHEDGDEDDPSLLIRELGLHEIDVPAQEGLYDPDRIPASEPEAVLLSRREVETQAALAQERYPSFDDELRQFNEDAPGFLDSVHAQASRWSPEAFELLLCGCASAWLILFIDRLPAVEPDPQRIRKLLASLASEMRATPARDAGDFVRSLSPACRQPRLFEHIEQMVFDLLEDFPEDERPKPPEVVRLLVNLRAVIDEFDRIASLD